MDIILENDDDRDQNFALHTLNDNCLLEIYKYLPLADCKNLAETSKRLKYIYMFRYHKFTSELHPDMLTKTSKNGKKVIDNILLEYGAHLRSWSLTINNSQTGDAAAGVEVLKLVSQYSTNLKRLELYGFGCGFVDFLRDCGEAAVCFGNVESLILDCCLLVDSLAFLECFRRLKHVHMTESDVSTNGLQIMFRNNPGIESFYGNSYKQCYSFCYCDSPHNSEMESSTNSNALGLCEFGPKFHKLCLNGKHDSLHMEKLMRLTTTSLTSLRLHFKYNTAGLTTFLTELAKQGCLKELELVGMELDNDSCNAIQLFENLELIVLCPDWNSIILTSAFIWPSKLKRCRSNLDITDNGFITLLHRLKFLTHLQLDSFRNGKRCLQTIYQSEMLDPRYFFRPTLHIIHDDDGDNYRQVLVASTVHLPFNRNHVSSHFVLGIH